MLEPFVARTREHIVHAAELLDVAQALELRRVDDLAAERADGDVSVYYKLYRARTRWCVNAHAAQYKAGGREDEGGPVAGRRTSRRALGESDHHAPHHRLADELGGYWAGDRMC